MDPVSAAMLFLAVAFVAWLAPSITSFIYLRFYYKEEEEKVEVSG